MSNKSSEIKRFIGLNFSFGACNLKCSYCYIGNHSGKIKDIPYSLEQIKCAFSKERLGGVCFINICSDGETLIHPLMPEIIKVFLQQGHYVAVVTNGVLTKAIDKCLVMDRVLLNRLFFKVSFHYEELVRLNLLQLEFENIKKIKDSPCSLTVEYTTDDKTLESLEEFQRICLENLGYYPQLNIPRDERKHYLGVTSKYSWENYLKRWDKTKFNSEFFEFRKQFFGKKYKDYCYTGERHIWVNMRTGYSHQCFHTPPIQNFMKEYNKPVKWLAVGNNCSEAHCYVSHSLMTLGIVPYPEGTTYKTTYDVIRDRHCLDGTNWIKPTYISAFRMGVEQKEHGKLKKRLVNKLNIILRWYRRRYPIT